MFAIVWRAAKPITRPSTALEARMPGREPLDLGEVAERERGADQQDGDEDEAADQPQPGLRRRARRVDVGDPAGDPPPRAITRRSTAKAIANATAIVIRAEIRSPLLLPEALVHRVSVFAHPRAGSSVRMLRMNRALPTRAVLLDALGTLVELEPPWPHLAEALGVEPDDRLVARRARRDGLLPGAQPRGTRRRLAGRPARAAAPACSRASSAARSQSRR